MSTTDSGLLSKMDGIHRIGWTACSGFTGRLRPDYAIRGHAMDFAISLTQAIMVTLNQKQSTIQRTG
jgi:hypothetical protein